MELYTEHTLSLWHKDGIDPATLRKRLEGREIYGKRIIPSPASNRTVVVFTDEPIPDADRQDIQRGRYHIS